MRVNGGSLRQVVSDVPVVSSFRPLCEIEGGHVSKCFHALSVGRLSRFGTRPSLPVGRDSVSEGFVSIPCRCCRRDQRVKEEKLGGEDVEVGRLRWWLIVAEVDESGW